MIYPYNHQAYILLHFSTEIKKMKKGQPKLSGIFSVLASEKTGAFSALVRYGLGVYEAILCFVNYLFEFGRFVLFHIVLLVNLSDTCILYHSKLRLQAIKINLLNTVSNGFCLRAIICCYLLFLRNIGMNDNTLKIRRNVL